jgi:hypothetical protein
MVVKGQTIFFIVLLCIVGVAVGFTLAWISPPPPQPANAPANTFSAGRAMQDLNVIAREPRAMGISQGRAEARDYLLDEIRALGLEPQVQDTYGLRVVQPGTVLAGHVENILARLPGTDPEGAILLMAHYDSSPGAPGAVDNGSSVVAIMEILRALQAGDPLRHDVIVFFTDGEEPGLIGSHAFVAEHPWWADVRLAINMDQLWLGPPYLYRTSGGNGLWVQSLARSAASTRPAYISFPFDLFPADDTDLLPIVQAGIPGADIVTGGPSTEKHTALDLPELVDPGSLQQAGDQILALVRELGTQTTLEASIPDQTFFPMFGMLVHYAEDLALPIAIVGAVCFLWMIVFGFHKRELTWRGLGLGFLASLLGIALSVVIANLLWKGVLAFHPEYAYVSLSGFRQKLSADSTYAIGFIWLAISVSLGAVALARKRVAALDLAAGMLVLWFPLAIATSILVPGINYLFSWVLIAGSLTLLLALAVRPRRDAWLFSGLGFLASAILAVLLWIPLFYMAILAGPMSPDTPLLSMLVGLAALWVGSMTPLLLQATSPQRWLVPAAALLVALGFLVAGNFLVGKDSPPPLVNSIGYWFDANEGEAYWLAFSDELDSRQSNLMVDPVSRSYRELLSAAPQISVRTSTAPMLDLDGPDLEVLSDEWVSNRRVVRIRITNSMRERILIILPQEPPLVGLILPDHEKAELPSVGSGGWWLRFEGMPAEGVEITFEFSGVGSIRGLLIEERTGLPSFPGLATQPEPGTMKSPGVFTQVIPTDFTAIARSFVIQE